MAQGFYSIFDDRKLRCEGIFSCLMKATSKQNHGGSTDGTCVSLPIQIQLLCSHFLVLANVFVSDIVSNDTTLIAVCGLYIYR